LERASGDHAPGIHQQHFQNLERFLFQTDAHSMLAKLARHEIDLERTEAN